MAFPISYMSKAIFSTPAKEKGTPIVSKRLRYFRSAFLFFCRIFYGAFTNSVILLLLQANSGLTSPGVNVSSAISEKKPPYKPITTPPLFVKQSYPLVVCSLELITLVTLIASQVVYQSIRYMLAV